MADRPIIFSGPMVRALLDGRKTMTRRLAWRAPHRLAAVHGIEVPSPWQKVKPGDRLWVRENFVKTPVGVDFAADGAAHYGAGGRLPITPCIHMPRIHSRLTLVVTATKIERLQHISDADAAAEGIPTHVVEHTFRKCYREDAERAAKRVEYFADLWTSLHGPDAWDANPEVVALTFKIERRNIDEHPADA